MEIEWDEEKNLKNYAKHKINFEFASKVFDDPLAKFILDRVVEGEERWHTIGRVSDRYLLLAAHCYRLANGNEVIRIISARPAISHERRKYEEG